MNERLIARTFKRLAGCRHVQLLDIGANSGLITNLAQTEAASLGVEVESTLMDIDRQALTLARGDVRTSGASYVLADASHMPFREVFDVAVFANALHLLDSDAKLLALDEVHRVLKPGGVLAVNTTFYEGAYPDESKPFYSRWIRRAITEINRRLPHRSKGERAQAMEWLGAEGYRNLIECRGFKVVESRERRVLLSQAAVRAISAYKEFAKGALHATDEDAEEAARALRVTVQQTFRDLQMKYLPRNWVEFVAVKA